MLSLLNNKWLKDLSKIIDFPDKKERSHIQNLRAEVKGILNKNLPTVEYWGENRKILMAKILKDDPRNFLNWTVIKDTMFYPGDVIELEYLKTSDDWEVIKNGLKEDRTGNPELYDLYPESSGNLIHHAYSLYQYLRKSKVNIDDLKVIFEFGGGYGSMCRLFYKLGFKGTYIIYDLPEFLALQKYFIQSIGLPVQFSSDLTGFMPNTIIQLSEFKQALNTDLFIGLWSLSEIPLSLRKKVTENIKSDSFLFAYQSNFANINNVDYFRNCFSRNNENLWFDQEIEHLPDNYYLIGV